MKHRAKGSWHWGSESSVANNPLEAPDSTQLYLFFHPYGVCIMKNTQKGYKGRNNFILSDSQAAIKALDSSR